MRKAPRARSLAEHLERQKPDDPDVNRERFDATMRKVLSVSKDELAKREAEYQASRPAIRRGRKKSA